MLHIKAPYENNGKKSEAEKMLILYCKIREKESWKTPYEICKNISTTQMKEEKIEDLINFFRKEAENYIKPESSKPILQKGIITKIKNCNERGADGLIIGENKTTYYFTISKNLLQNKILNVNDKALISSPITLSNNKTKVTLIKLL